MIGKFIRSAHHLKHSGGYLKPIQVIGIRQNNVILGEAIVGKDREGRDKFFYFQDANCNIEGHKIKQYCDDITFKAVSPMFSKHQRCMLMSHFDEFRHFGTQFVMLPEDFDKQYEEFTQKNRKMLTPIFGKYLSKDEALSKILFAFCESGNFFAWAAKCIRQNRISLMSIYRLMYWQKAYSQLVCKLKKGTITAYNNTHDVLLLLNECQELRKAKRANDIVNMFNTEQKRILKDNFAKIPIELLNKFAILSSTKQQNFIRKVSTITDLDEIIRLLSFTTSAHFAWNKASLIDYINNVEGLNCKIIFENDSCVVVDVKDYETIKRLAKTTNWCISKNKSYWNNYMSERKNATQYILFDFSKKEDDELSIVGFTTNDNRGITHAHSFTNNNLMTDSGMEDNDEPYQNLLRGANKRNGIYAVISANNIPLSLITKFRSKFTTWDKKSFFEIFDKFISPETYNIYHDKDNVVVLSTRNWEGVSNLFGQPYMNKFCDYYRSNEHIFFLDFNKDVEDCDKLKYAIVVQSSTNNTCSSTTALYNEFCIKSKDKFNKVIADLGMPYNIICRPDTVKNRFSEALSSHDVEEMEKLIDNDEVREMLSCKRNNNIKQAFKNELISSMMNYNSVQLLDIVENHGFHLKDILNYSEIRYIFERFYNNAGGTNGFNYMRGAQSKYTEEKLFTDLLDNHMNEYNDSQKNYILYCYLANRLLKPFVNDVKALTVILGGLLNNMSDYYYGGLISKKVGMILVDLLNLNEVNTSLANFLSYIFNNNMAECIDKLLEKDITDKHVRNAILSYAPTKYALKFKSKWGIEEKPKEEAKAEDMSFAEAMKASSTYETYSFANTPWDVTWEVLGR